MEGPKEFKNCNTFSSDVAILYLVKLLMSPMQTEATFLANNSQHCCELFSSFACSYKFDRIRSRILARLASLAQIGELMLAGYNFSTTTPNNMQQSVQTDTTCNIQQCWEFLANNVVSVCKRL